MAVGAGATVGDKADAAWAVLASHVPPLTPRGAAESPPSAAPAPAKAEPAAVESAPAAAPPPDVAVAPARLPLPRARAGRRRGATLHALTRTRPLPPATRATALLLVGARIEAGARHFSYVDRLTSTLRDYDLGAVPLVSVNAAVYPLARTSIPVLKGLGATFDYALALGLKSTDSSGASVSTGWSSFDVGVRERIPLGRLVTLGLHGGYGEIGYSFQSTLGATAQLPDVHYRFIEGGLDGEVSFAGFSVYASGGYLGVLSTGTLGTYFPRATVGGIEGRVGVARELGHGFEVSLEAGYTRFFYAMNPEPGDPYVAGGALDEIERGSLGAA